MTTNLDPFESAVSPLLANLAFQEQFTYALISGDRLFCHLKHFSFQYSHAVDEFDLLRSKLWTSLTNLDEDLDYATIKNRCESQWPTQDEYDTAHGVDGAANAMDLHLTLLESHRVRSLGDFRKLFEYVVEAVDSYVHSKYGVFGTRKVGSGFYDFEIIKAMKPVSVETFREVTDHAVELEVEDAQFVAQLGTVLDFQKVSLAQDHSRKQLERAYWCPCFSPI